MDEIISTVNAEPEVTVEPQQTESVETNVDSVNADNKEVKSTQQDVKPVQTLEENAKFAEQRRAREAAEAKAQKLEKDYSISKTYSSDWGVHSVEDIAEKYGHLGITTIEQFETAVKEYEMKEKGVDPDAVKKYVDEDPDVKEARQIKRDREQYKEFAQEFGDISIDKIPTEVLAEYAKGKNLTDAYARHMVRQHKAEAEKAKAEETKLKANEANANSSMGSVSGDSAAVSQDYINFDTFQANKNNTNWVNKNYEKIMKSRAKW